MLHLYFFVCIKSLLRIFALVAELVDAADLKSVGSNPVPVRFRPSAPIKKEVFMASFFIGMIYEVLAQHTKKHGKIVLAVSFNKMLNHLLVNST